MKTDSTSTTQFAWPEVAVLAGFALGLLLVYSPSLSGPFIFDDLDNIVTNSQIQEFPPKLDWSNPLSRPIALLTFSLDWFVGRGNPVVFRLTNLFLHWCLAILLYQCSLRLIALDESISSKIASESQSRLLAVFVTAVWCFHPISSAAVCYIVQRAEILASLGMVACLLAYLRFIESRRIIWMVVAFLSILFGVYSKVNAIAIVPVVVLFDLVYSSRLSKNAKAPRRDWAIVRKNFNGRPRLEKDEIQHGGVSGVIRPRRNLAFLAICLAMAGIAVIYVLPRVVGGDAGVGFEGGQHTTRNYLLTQSKVVWLYWSDIVFPRQLCIDHQMRFITDARDALPWIILCLLAASAIVVLIVRKSIHGWLLASYVLILSPTSSFIPIVDPRIDHRVYLASFFVLLSGVLAVSSLVARTSILTSHREIWVRFGAASLVLSLSFLTYLRAHDWSSGFALWSQTCEVAPENTRALQNLHVAALSEGMESQLLPFLENHFEKCVGKGINPGPIASRLGQIYLQNERLAEGEAALLMALARIDAKRSEWDRAELFATRMNLGILRTRQGRLEEASLELRESITLDPYNPYACALLAEVEEKRGNLENAVALLERAIQLNPAFDQAKGDLQRIQERLPKNGK